MGTVGESIKELDAKIESQESVMGELNANADRQAAIIEELKREIQTLKQQ